MSRFRWMALILAVSVSAWAQPRLAIDSVNARHLGRWMKYSTLLPDSYSTTKRYPVLYLLHGYTGNNTNWWRLTKLQEYCKHLPLIVVMPDAENSWYVNSLADPQNRYEDYLTEDLYNAVRARYAIDTTRQAIAGLSMGGYGALVLALRHPHRFEFCGPLSASLDVPRDIAKLEENGRAALRPSLERALGATHSAQWDEHDPWLLFKRWKATELPYFFLANGIQDEFKHRVDLYEAFADSLRATGIRYEYHEEPGRHNFEFWDHELPPMLKRMREVMKF